MEKVKSQTQIIAEYLKSGKSIDCSTAYRICGTMCLAQRIADLKRPPHNLKIDSKMIYEKGKNYAVYSLKSEMEKPGFWKRICSNVGIW